MPFKFCGYNFQNAFRVSLGISLNARLHLGSDDRRNFVGKTSTQNDHLRIQKIDKVRESGSENVTSATDKSFDVAVSIGYRLRQRPSRNVGGIFAYGFK